MKIRTEVRSFDTLGRDLAGRCKSQAQFGSHLADRAVGIGGFKIVMTRNAGGLRGVSAYVLDQTVPDKPGSPLRTVFTVETGVDATPREKPSHEDGADFRETYMNVTCMAQTGNLEHQENLEPLCPHYHDKIGADNAIERPFVEGFQTFPVLTSFDFTAILPQGGVIGGLYAGAFMEESSKIDKHFSLRLDAGFKAYPGNIEGLLNVRASGYALQTSRMIPQLFRATPGGNHFDCNYEQEIAAAVCLICDFSLEFEGGGGQRISEISCGLLSPLKIDRPGAGSKVSGNIACELKSEGGSEAGADSFVNVLILAVPRGE